MLAIPQELSNRLYNTLVKCPQFDSHKELQSIFVTSTLAPWHNRLPQTDNHDSRVRQTIALLYKQRNVHGQNALVLLLRVLGEYFDPDDALRYELSALANAVEAYLETEQAKSVSSPLVAKSPMSQTSAYLIPTDVTLDVTCKVDIAGMRAQLERYDVVQIKDLCLDHFSQVYDRFGRGLRRDEMINLLLDHTRHYSEEAEKLSRLLAQDIPKQQVFIPETILIPAGEFWMGSADDDPDAQLNEKPRHMLSLPTYKIGKYPVTNAQYRAFIQKTGHTSPTHWTEGQIPSIKEDHPVVYISLLDAQAYCRWLSRETGCTYRLPSEQEWEKTARGTFPDDRRYPWGSVWRENYCNTCEDGCRDTTPVATYEATNKSPFGVIDMVGNVWEWTNSVYGPYDTSYSSLVSFAGVKYVVRGGACTIEHVSARISCRGRYRPNERKAYLGFRVAMDV